jgi:hypothetical protein
MTQLTQVFDLILKQFTSNHIFDDIKIQLFEAIFKYLNVRWETSLKHLPVTYDSLH